MYAYRYENSLETEVMSATPLRLIQLLYQGALESVRSARLHLEMGNIAERSKQVTKAQQVLAELALSLDREKGGNVAGSLAELYDYAQRRLAEGNFRQEDAPFAEVENLIATLADAWNQCVAEEDSVPIGVLAAAGPVGAHLPCECFG